MSTAKTRPSKSLLFSSYNRIKARARRSGQDTKRVDRALGLAQTTKRAARPYRTDNSACSCADNFYRRVKCKHMIALELAQAQVRKPNPAVILAELGF